MTRSTTVSAKSSADETKSPAGGAKPPRDQPVGKRRRAREIAVQMLYQREVGGRPLEEIFAGYHLYDYLWETEAAQRSGDDDTEEPGEPRSLGDAERRQMEDAFAYAQKLLQGVEQHRERIDERIREHAENWRLERMPLIDRNILRLAIYEMLFEAGVPKVVIVDEAIELAKKFGSENSGRFVNGLLDAVLKSETGGRSSSPSKPSSPSKRSRRPGPRAGSGSPA